MGLKSLDEVNFLLTKILDISIGLTKYLTFLYSFCFRTFFVRFEVARKALTDYITNITNQTEVQMDLLLIIALSLSFWLGLLILQSMARIIHRSETVRKRFDR